MFATLPGWVEDIIRLWPAWAAIGTVISAWLLWSFKTWVKVHIADPLAHLRTEQTATHHLVRYHLGPNGNTKPMFKRVADIEEAAGIHDAVKDWPKWEGD